MAILNTLCNPKDRMSFERAVDECCSGIGEKTLEQVAVLSRTKGQDVIAAAREIAANDNAHSRTLAEFLSVVDKTNGLPADQRLLNIAQQTHLWEWMRVDSQPDNDRCANITEFANDLGRYLAAGNTLDNYLQSVSLLTSEDESSADDEIKLMTLHGCKGLEFDAVIISHANQGIIPHTRTLTMPNGPERDLQLEEERRLFYVGMTRARKFLRIFSCRRRPGRGNQQDVFAPSVFIREAGLSQS